MSGAIRNPLRSLSSAGMLCVHIERPRRFRSVIVDGGVRASYSRHNLSHAQGLGVRRAALKITFLFGSFQRTAGAGSGTVTWKPPLPLPNVCPRFCDTAVEQLARAHPAHGLALLPSHLHNACFASLDVSAGFLKVPSGSARGPPWRQNWPIYRHREGATSMGRTFCCSAPLPPPNSLPHPRCSLALSALLLFCSFLTRKLGRL